MNFSNIDQYYHNRLPVQMLVGQVYAWCEINYLHESSPEEIYTVRKPMPVATLEEYVGLLIIQKRHRYERMCSNLFHDLSRQHAPANLIEQSNHEKGSRTDLNFVMEFLRYLDQIKKLNEHQG